MLGWRWKVGWSKCNLGLEAGKDDWEGLGGGCKAEVDV